MRNNYILGTIGLVLSAAVAAQDKPSEQASLQSSRAEWSFDKDEAGKAVPAWRVAETAGTGKLGKWIVTVDDSAPSKPNVLKLDTQADEKTFNLCIAEKSSFKDLDLRVRIKANSGKEDQGGGLIWRCQDENNYYICRINPLEGNFRVYKVADGKRKQLESTKLETVSGKWYEVRATMLADRIACYVDGKKLLEAKDDTFKDAGMVGLWTKADASSSFDNLAVTLPQPGPAGKGEAKAGEKKPTDKHDGEKDDDDDDDDD